MIPTIGTLNLQTRPYLTVIGWGQQRWLSHAQLLTCEGALLEPFLRPVYDSKQHYRCIHTYICIHLSLLSTHKYMYIIYIYIYIDTSFTTFLNIYICIHIYLYMNMSI